MAVQLVPEIPEVVAKPFAPEVPEVAAAAKPELGAIQRGTKLCTGSIPLDCHTSTNIVLFGAGTSEQALE
jgi:hypothetical protein